MSRIGNRILNIPSGVTITVGENNHVIVKGSKGELNNNFDSRIKIIVEESTVKTTRDSEAATVVSLHGTTNALLRNMLIGVSEGFKKGLECVGVGYKFNVQGNKIVVNAGYSNPVEKQIPSGLKLEQISNTEISVEGINKQEVNEFAAKIREIRQPEPYKGKGIRYKGEHVRRKDGKKAS